MCRVLVVEDDDDIRTDLCEILRDEGYEATGARHGAEALNLLRSGERPAVILLDLMMPVMNGWVFRDEQIRDPELSSIPVIVMTGMAEAKDHATSLRFAGWVTKPLNLDMLFQQLAQHCRD